MRRKIIQITTTSIGDKDDMSDIIVALCSDGSLWELYYSEEWNDTKGMNIRRRRWQRINIEVVTGEDDPIIR